MGGNADRQRRDEQRRQVRTTWHTLRAFWRLSRTLHILPLRYTTKDLEARGAQPNDVSSLVVHYGDEGSVITKQQDVKDKRASGIPQRGQIDSLDWSNFDEYMQVAPTLNRLFRMQA